MEPRGPLRLVADSGATATDHALLAAFARERSEAAFAALYSRHAPMVHAVSLRVLRDPHAAEDATQATFLVLARRAGTLADGVSVTGWLHLTAVNAARRIRRTQMRRRTREDEVARTAPTSHHPMDPLPDPRADLDAALESLPRAQRDALLLRYVTGLSESEAAAQLRCSKDTLHSRVKLGLAKLRERFARRGLADVAVIALLGEPPTHAAPASSHVVAACVGKATASAGALAAADAIVAAISAAKLAWAAALALAVAASATAAVIAAALRSPELRLASPRAGDALAGEVTFAVAALGRDRVATVEYLLDDEPLTRDGEPVGPVSPEDALRWNAANTWDGVAWVRAIGRDPTGRIVARSAAVPVTVANGAARIALVGPRAAAPLRGIAQWCFAASALPDTTDPAVWQCFVDGRQIEAHAEGGRLRVDLDTRRLPDGPHELHCAVWTEAARNGAAAQLSLPFTTDNGAEPCELRTGWRSLRLAVGDRASLSPRIVSCAGAETAVEGRFATAAADIAAVESGGTVVGRATGSTAVTVTAGDLTTTVAVTVGPRRFPHLSLGGGIVDRVDPSRSHVLRTIVALDAQQFETKPGLADAVAAAGINAISVPFYANPAESTVRDTWEEWRRGMDAEFARAAALADRFGLYATGDDLCGTPAEFHDTATDAQAARRIRYAAQLVAASGKVYGVDLLSGADATLGATPLPVDGRWSAGDQGAPDHAILSIMDAIRAGAPRLPVTWTVNAAADDAAFAAWSADRRFADFAECVWLPAGEQPAFADRWSLPQVLAALDEALTRRRSALGDDRPMIASVLVEGPSYRRDSRGDGFSAGRDLLLAPAFQPRDIAAQVMLSVMRGAAGIRAYGFDADHDRRNREAAAIGETCSLRCEPFNVGTARWRALSAAFGLVRDLEPLLLEPLADAPDLGRDVLSAARSGDAGDILIALNTAESPRRFVIHDSSFAAGAAERHRLLGDRRRDEPPSGRSVEVVELAPGECCVWATARR